MARAALLDARCSTYNSSDSAMLFGLVDDKKFGHLERVTDGVAMIHSFANVAAVYGRGGVLLADTAVPMLTGAILMALRAETNEPIRHIVYTHGHADHAAGAAVILDEARARGDGRPTIWAHARVPRRFDRYRRTWAWNNEVNRRQFGGARGVAVFPPPEGFVPPDRTYAGSAELDLEGERVVLRHAEGETDDATWVWLPDRKVALVGDLLIGSIPNAGNPNKPQRYTAGWADALTAIAAEGPEHVVPGHGDPLHGAQAIEVLTETARALRYLHDAVIDRLNAGKWPDEIARERIALPPDLAARAYLKPLYGSAEFIVRDVLRAYAGWWGGDIAELLPAPRSDVARDLIEVAGREAMAVKIKDLLAAGEARRALHLAQIVSEADPADPAGQTLLAEALEARFAEEPSFIARSFYRAAADELKAAAKGDTPSGG